MWITRVSQATGIEHTRDIALTVQQLGRWCCGEYIQDVAPNLSDDDREFIMTGITAEEWDDIFSEDDEENSDGTES